MVEARTDTDRVSVVLKKLFGKPLRILLACWISRLESGTFILKDAQLAMEAIGQPRSGVPTELRVFTSLGMLGEMKLSNKVYFSKQESALWHIFEAIEQAMELPMPDETAQASPRI